MSESISNFDPCEALTVREAAGLLHVSRPTVEKYIKAGELPSILIGRCRRIRRTDLEAFLEQRIAYDWRRLRDIPSGRPASRPIGNEGDQADEEYGIPF